MQRFGWFDCIGKRGKKEKILHSRQAKFFELCSVNRGLDVGAFNSYEDAINWLFPASEMPSEDGG